MPYSFGLSLSKQTTAQRVGEQGGVVTYRFDVRVQGPDAAQETVFFDV